MVPWWLPVDLPNISAIIDRLETWLVPIERSFQGLSVAIETMRIDEELMEIWPNEVCDRAAEGVDWRSVGIERCSSNRRVLPPKGRGFLSQTSFGHISINSSLILMVSMATESPWKDLSINTSHVSRQSIMAKILDRSTGNHHGTIY